MSITKTNLPLEGLRPAQAHNGTVCAQAAQNQFYPSKARAMRETHAPKPVPLLERFDNAEDQIEFMKMFLRNLAHLNARAMQ